MRSARVGPDPGRAEAANLTGRGPLRRSRRHRLIAGVCGGIAEWRGWNAAAVRALFVVGSLAPIVPGFVVYLVLWLVVPRED